MYKQVVYKHGHPLANKKGAIRKSRFVLYEKLKGEAGKCNWCKIKLIWKTLCADHLDSDIMNDVPENLVGSCRGCNANREDGTGHGRKAPKKCKVCKKIFIYKQQKIQIYCCIKCASQDRPKRGTKTQHGTRSRYVHGCRCDKCKEINTNYWRINYSIKLNPEKAKSYEKRTQSKM